MRSALSLVALLGLLCTASAFRITPRDLDLPGGLSVQQLQTFVTGQHNKKDKEGPVYFAIKFTVPPHEYKDFTKAWQDLEEDAVKDRGNLIYDLKKTLTDDLFFFHYSEWETGRDLFDHLTSSHFKDFVEYTTKSNVVWELEMLRNPDEQEQDRQLRRNVERKKGDDKEQAHVLVRVIVRPSDAEDFIKEWQKTADATVEKEKGNSIYSLRKPARDNLSYWIYGTWDSMKDYAEHVKSDHVLKLLEFYADRDIAFFRSPLIKYGHDDEGRL